MILCFDYAFWLFGLGGSLLEVWVSCRCYFWCSELGDDWFVVRQGLGQIWVLGGFGLFRDERSGFGCFGG